MKKKIIIGLSIFALIFFIGGIYIITTVAMTTTKLSRLVTLHQVEILREHLLLSIKRVQTNLNLKDTRYARSIEETVKDVGNMSRVADSCVHCHHSEKVTERLYDLKNHVAYYRDALSRIYTIHAGQARTAAAQDQAYKVGEALTEKVSNIIAITSSKVAAETEAAMKEISKTKIILFILVAIGPVMALGLVFIFIRGFTKPIDSLRTAIRKIKGGDLDHKIQEMPDEFGEVASAFNDMSASLKEHVNKIEVSEKRYRALFEGAGDTIFIISLEDEDKGRIISANQAAAITHGYTINEMLEMNISDIDTPESAARIPERIQNILDGKWIHFEVDHRKKDGTVFPVEVSAGLLELGGKKHILAFNRDITERKHTAEALQRTEQLRVAGDLAAGLTHELKNSLAGIKIAIEVLLDELSLAEEDRTVLMRMIHEIRRIELLMRDLLNFARPSKPQFSFVNINAILDTSISFSLRNVLEGKNESGRVSLIKNLDQNLPRTMADPMQLQQIFMNLLLNAVESLPSGGLVTVQTAYDEAAHSIKIGISDTGKGISEELMDRIFNPFVTSKPKGTGLGLPITKRLVEQHQGTITIANNADGGATFSIVLPVRTINEVEIT